MLEEIQTLVFSRLCFDAPPIPHQPVIPQLLQIILNENPEHVERALGKFGQKLRLFAETADLSHPDLPKIFNNTENLCEEITELLDLTKYAESKKFNKVLPILSKKVVKNRFFGSYIRFLKERTEARRQKKPQVVDVSLVLNKKGEEFWHGQPATFESFVRYNEPYKEEIAIAEKKAKRYLELGCCGLYDHIKESIESFRSHMHDFYYGFNRVTITNASVILARSLGFQLTEITGSFSNSKSYKITTQKDTYEPRVYPYYKLEYRAPADVKQIIAHLEALPEAGCRPIFDNFLVLLPGLAISAKENGFSVSSPEGLLVVYSDYEEATFALDNYLLDSNSACPLLLGEKDSRCYFICYWR